MGRKVFISFLGTNNYVECKYLFDGKESCPVRFVQEVLIENLCREWTEDDKILIFCTSQEKTGVKGSKEINWEDNGQDKPLEEIEKIGLKHRLDDLVARIHLRASIEEVDIEAGFSESEVWGIFDTVYAKLERDDQIYFDVTHAFRSIPLLSVVLFNFSKFMLGTQVMSILYGAFEKLGPAFLVRKMSVEQRLSPVLDLSNIVRLQEYNQFASSLREFGKVAALGDAVAGVCGGQVLKQLSKSIKDMDGLIQTINLKEIKKGQFIKKFREQLQVAKRRERLPKPILQVLKQLEQETQGFQTDSFANIEAAIRWTVSHDMLMHSFPLTQEYIVYRIADKLSDLKPESMDMKAFRQFVAPLLGMPDKSFRSRQWGYPLNAYPRLASYFATLPMITALRPSYNQLTSARNSLAHANGSYTFTDLKEKYIPQIEESVKVLNATIDLVEIKMPQPLSGLFVNLSNHPSSAWGDRQREAAEAIGEIRDLDFPQIAPDASEEEVQGLAAEYACRIGELAAEAEVTVHVMGEMTFVYALVSMLRGRGIRCVASTTQRKVEEHDGVKTSVFAFVGFREYS